MDEKQFSEGSLLVILLSWTLPRFMKPVWSQYGADWPLESMLLVISFAPYINLISLPSVYEMKSSGLYH